MPLAKGAGTVASRQRRFKTGALGSKSRTKPSIPKTSAPDVPKPPAFDRITGPLNDMPDYFTKAMPTGVANYMIQTGVPLARRFTSGLIALNALEGFATSTLPQVLEPAFHPFFKMMPQFAQKSILMKLGVYPVTGALTQGFNVGRGAGLSAAMLLSPAPGGFVKRPPNPLGRGIQPQPSVRALRGLAIESRSPRSIRR